MNDPIIINVYDRAWPMLFETEKKLLLPVIAGAAIEHIGSTAVEGLWAKPVIDIMIGISDDEELDRLIPSIEKLGYSYHPEFEHEMPERRYFRKEKNGIRTHQI